MSWEQVPHGVFCAVPPPYCVSFGTRGHPNGYLDTQHLRPKCPDGKEQIITHSLLTNPVTDSCLPR